MSFSALGSDILRHLVPDLNISPVGLRGSPTEDFGGSKLVTFLPLSGARPELSHKGDKKISGNLLLSSFNRFSNQKTILSTKLILYTLSSNASKVFLSHPFV